MQWLQTTDQGESLTVNQLIDQGEITVNYGVYILSAGLKSAETLLRKALTGSPLLEQLSCSVERVTAALTALRSLTERNESVNGHTLVKNVSEHSLGYEKCFLLTEECLVLGYLGMAVENSYLRV